MLAERRAERQRRAACGGYGGGRDCTGAFAHGRAPASRDRRSSAVPAGGALRLPTATSCRATRTPFEPLPSVVDAVAATAATINRYPDATALSLREKLAERFGTTSDEVIVGGGSVALLAAFIQAAASGRRGRLLVAVVRGLPPGS